MHRLPLPRPALLSLAFFSVFSVSSVVSSFGAEPTYWQDIRPVLRKNCTVCHSVRNLKELDVSGGLALDSYEAIRKGSKQPVIQPGKSAASLLIKLLQCPGCCFPYFLIFVFKCLKERFYSIACP